ncbi:glutamate--cysteine ligase [Neptuniibacter caesariensis]|uniref:Glutamate--cysteine ligase n=1 Tax=Neptuniibacter caesariensis TaxID=207954 RepID=A0A7U8C6J7_NEPCE|nr:glutamate--cysteine ligase [Neptuniibacter caesariensis]EAR61179.1 glutamate--cysteine ligase [Oceanospirillum sp. MED92] [Neptuniibacter caesariensis]
MSSTLEQKLSWLKNEGHAELLTRLKHGIEKEGLRVDPQRNLAQTPHPKSLGSALTHGNITTDYSEALLEFITPVFEKSSEALDFLADLHRYTYQNLDNEQVWPASMPCVLPEEDQIPIARYGSSNIGQMKYFYRVGLEHRYGKIMQTIAGIHYNFSMPDEFWPLYQAYQQKEGSLQEFRSAGYFSLIRNFRRYSWLLMYLFGASPALCSSFLKGKDHQLEELSPGTLYLPYATSLRMSDLGYSNKAQASLNICFNHLNTYASSLDRAIRTPYEPYEKIGVKVEGQYRQLNTNILQIENEYYSDIRPKRVTQSGEKPIHALMARGVEYIEVRNTDINPFLPLGIDQIQSDFLDLFLITCLLMEEKEISVEECDQINENHQRVVTRGREPGLTLIHNDEEQLLAEWGFELLAEIGKTASLLDGYLSGTRYTEAVAVQAEKLGNPELTPSAQILAVMREQNLNHGEFVMQQAEAHKQTLLSEPVSTVMAETLAKLSKSSLEEQAEIEAADQDDFDTFLANYMAS